MERYRYKIERQSNSETPQLYDTIHKIPEGILIERTALQQNSATGKQSMEFVIRGPFDKLSILEALGHALIPA